VGRTIGLVALSAVAGVALLAGAASSRGATTNVCRELPVQLRSACNAPGVTCTATPDKRSRWETVFATEPTMRHAMVMARLAYKRGFGHMPIETDALCSNGKGVYEVSHSRFRNRSSAVNLLKKARAAGFGYARVEES
jgi:hypothetical protein